MFNLNQLIGKTISKASRLIDPEDPNELAWIQLDFTDGGSYLIEASCQDYGQRAFVDLVERPAVNKLFLLEEDFNNIPSILSESKFWELIKRLRPYIVEDEEASGAYDVIKDHSYCELLSFVFRYKQTKNSLHQKLLYQYFSMFEIIGKTDEVTFDYTKEGIVFQGKLLVETALKNPDDLADFFTDKYDFRDKLIGAGIDIEDLLSRYWIVGPDPESLPKMKKLGREEAKRLFPKTVKLLEL